MILLRQTIRFGDAKIYLPPLENLSQLKAERERALQADTQETLRRGGYRAKQSAGRQFLQANQEKEPSFSRTQKMLSHLSELQTLEKRLDKAYCNHHTVILDGPTGDPLHSYHHVVGRDVRPEGTVYELRESTEAARVDLPPMWDLNFFWSERKNQLASIFRASCQLAQMETAQDVQHPGQFWVG